MTKKKVNSVNKSTAAGPTNAGQIPFDEMVRLEVQRQLQQQTPLVCDSVAALPTSKLVQLAGTRDQIEARLTWLREQRRQYKNELRANGRNIDAVLLSLVNVEENMCDVLSSTQD